MKYYNKNPFSTFRQSVPVPLNIHWDNYAICKACPFIFPVLYTKVSAVVPPTDSSVVYNLPLYDTLYIIEMQCTFSVEAIVSSLIQLSTRSATTNKPKGAARGYLLGMNWVCLRRLCVCRFRANMLYLLDINNNYFRSSKRNVQ